MKEYLLGIDIGTSSCKVAAYTPEGCVKASATENYPVYYPGQGWAEQNPNEWWDAVCRAVPLTLEKGGIKPEEIKGIGIDGQSWSAVAIDKTGKVLINTPIWMDTRAVDICNELNEEIGSENIFDLCGNSLQPSYTTAKIIWYKRNFPDVYSKIYKILQSNSYIAYKLTGVVSQDLSQGYGLHCFNISKGIWDLEMCKALGFSRELLPDIYPCHEIIGTVTQKAAEESGLISGIPVAAGGLDAACGALGAGVIHSGETQEQGGQAGGMSICTDKCITDERLISGHHVVQGRWLLQGGTTGGGGVMRWLEQEFGAYERETGSRSGKSPLEIFNEEASEINPGSDGLIFLPYMSGERTPIWDPNAKGVYYGLDFSKTKAHFIRAAMEGTAYALRHNLEVAEKAGASVKLLRAVGGAANSLLWTQIKSDITNKPIVVSSSDTATTMGAAILAGVGTGIYKDFDEAVKLTVKEKRSYYPNSDNKAVYDRDYESYREIYIQLKGIMKKRGGSVV